jgi:hypothetical protein
VVKGELVLTPSFFRKVALALSVTGDLKVPFMLIASDWYKDNRQIENLKGPGMYPDYKGERDDTAKESYAPRGKKVKDGLTPYMRKKKREVGFVYPLLKYTGRLLRSITVPGAEDAVMIVGPKSLVLGTSVDYAIYHQSAAPRKKMPYRPMIFNKAVYGGHANIYQSRIKRYNRILEVYIRKKMRSI